MDRFFQKAGNGIAGVRVILWYSPAKSGMVGRYIVCIAFVMLADAVDIVQLVKIVRVSVEYSV